MRTVATAKIKDPDEEALLSSELAARATMSGGSGEGTRLMAKLLRTAVHETQVILDQGPDRVCTDVFTLLRVHGRLTEEPVAGDEYRIMRAVFNSRNWWKNPVVLTVTLTPAEHTDYTVVRVRSASKEGLIPQHAHRKVARRFLNALASM
jgi:hypothetical protein